jgi:hypothetical protein
VAADEEAAGADGLAGAHHPAHEQVRAGGLPRIAEPDSAPGARRRNGSSVGAGADDMIDRSGPAARRRR